MPPLDWSALLSLAPNLATAIAFGYFMLKLLDRIDRQNDKRDDEWRSFLADGREQYTASVSTVTAEMKTMADVLRDAHQILTKHDDWERSEMVREHQDRAEAVRSAAEAVKVAAQVAVLAVEASRRIVN